MSMIGNLLRVSSEELHSYLMDSELLDRRVEAEDFSADPNLLDIDKTWEAIFYTITGGSTAATVEDAPTPIGWAVFNPAIIDADQDLGYGPASYSTAAQVKEISAALNNFTTADFLYKFDPHNMTKKGIYPGYWNKKVHLTYILEYFDGIKAFYQEAANNDQAVIMFIN